MKILITKNAGSIIRLSACLCLLALLMINVVGAAVDCRYISVFAAAGDADMYEIKSRLLMEAFRHVGVCTPEQAARVWGDGLKMRSAAMQYSVMSEELKKEYARQLEQTAPNWVTGISSPWIDSYEITNTEYGGEGLYIISLIFSTMTSTGMAGNYNAALTIAKQGDFWRIKSIKADRGLYPYMGFTLR